MKVIIFMIASVISIIAGVIEIMKSKRDKKVRKVRKDRKDGEEGKAGKHKRGYIFLAVGIIGFFSEAVKEGTTIAISVPEITKNEDSTRIILSTEKYVDIEYRISANSEAGWIEYENPIALSENAILYVRAKQFWMKSDIISQDVFVAENGLLYFGGADGPGNSIEEIESIEYNYRNADEGKSGNYYAGYKIKKDDIKVYGRTLNDEIEEISNFTYSPEILEKGDNIITVSYQIADGMKPLTSTMVVTANDPKLMKLEVERKNDEIYLDTDLRDVITVKGKCEDGSLREINDYKISSNELREGKNEITVISGEVSIKYIINAIDRESVEGKEKEPNNEIGSGNKIEVNVEYTGTLANEEDVDYYKIEVAEKGKIQLLFIHDKMDDSHNFWKMSLLSNEKDSIAELYSQGSNLETDSNVVRVQAGTYYLRVTHEYYSDKKYTFKVVFTPEDNSYETEPNNELNGNLKDKKSEISVNKEYHGNIQSENDVDYYRFQLEEKSKVYIGFWHEKMNNERKFWKVSLIGNTEEYLINLGSSGVDTERISDSVRLPKGVYYIKIDNDYWTDMDYKFCVFAKAEGESAEIEPNNDYGIATKIESGNIMVGNIQSNSDEDFYWFNLNNPGTLAVIFAHQKIDNDRTFWRLELYSDNSGEAIPDQNNNSYINIRGDSDSNINLMWPNLVAGKYYIKVSPYDYNNDDYSMTIAY